MGCSRRSADAEEDCSMPLIVPFFGCFSNAANMAVMYLFFVFIISALNTNCTVKFNLNTSKFSQINKFVPVTFPILLMFHGSAEQ